jgi:heme-degrading monooxygenase HmoA
MDRSDGGPVRAVLTMTVPAARAAEFEAEWCRVAAWVARQPGCLRQTLGRDEAAAPHSYVITSDWVDRAAFERFERDSQQDDATARLRQMRTGAAMQLLAIVEHREFQ